WRPGKGRGRTREVGKFETRTTALLALADWLTAAGVRHVAMESTGGLGKPVFNVREGSFEVILVNPQHFKAVPGRKTDVRDCAWLARARLCLAGPPAGVRAPARALHSTAAHPRTPRPDTLPQGPDPAAHDRGQP